MRRLGRSDGKTCRADPSAGRPRTTPFNEALTNGPLNLPQADARGGPVALWSGAGMAAKAQAPAGAEKEPAKGGKKKLVMLAGVAVLLLLGGGGGAAYFLGLFGGGGEKAEAAGDGHGDGEDHDAAATAAADAADGHGAKAGSGEAHAGGDGHAAGAGSPGAVVAFVDLPDVLVNLRSDGKRMRFLKLRVALEVDSDKSAEGVKALTPRVMDSFQMYLRALSVDEIQGSAGMQKLKEEMMARVNLAIEPHRIRDVLFKELLVQ